MKFYMKMLFLMLLASCITIIPTGSARPLTMNYMGESSLMVKSMLLAPDSSTEDVVLSVFSVPLASPELFSASELRASAEDVLPVSSETKESPGDVSVSSVPTSRMHVVPKASLGHGMSGASAEHVSSVPKASPVLVTVDSEPKLSPKQVSLSFSVPKASPMHVFSIPSTSSSESKGHVMSRASPEHASSEPDASPGHVSIATAEPSPGNFN